MSAQFAHPVRFDEQQYLQDQQLKNKRFALQLWRLANFGIFAFFALTNYLIRQTQATWPPAGVDRLDPTLPALFSVVLLLSAIPAQLVQRSIRHDNPSAAKRNIIFTAILAVVFLAGLYMIWKQVPYSGSYSAIFFVMTGFHAVHVIVGLLLFTYVFVKTSRGAYSRTAYWGIEATVVFWHFVEIMWAFYFLILYIL
jgi:cytochrome c oxidase subunit 3